MKKEAIWQIGPTARKIHCKLSQKLRQVEDSPDIYLSNDFMRDVGVRKHDWDLADFFACMTEEDFTKLSPSDPDPDPELPFISYEDVEYPESDPPYNVVAFDHCAFRVEQFLRNFKCGKHPWMGMVTSGQ